MSADGPEQEHISKQKLLEAFDMLEIDITQPVAEYMVAQLFGHTFDLDMLPFHELFIGYISEDDDLFDDVMTDSQQEADS